MSSDEKSLPPIIENIYDIVVEPGRLEQLCDVWTLHLQGAGDPSSFDVLGEPGVLPHVERVAAALRHLLDAAETSSAPPTSPTAWVNAIRAAAIIVAPGGEIVAANAAAQTDLGVDAGQTIADMPVEPSDLKVLQSRLAYSQGNGHCIANDTGNINGKAGSPVLFRLQLKSKPAPALIRMVEGAGGNPAHFGLVTTILAWPPDLSSLLQKAFSLTAAEVDVMKDLALGQSVRDIAVNSNRSEPTVRSHVRAVLAKTETTTSR